MCTTVGVSRPCDDDDSGDGRFLAEVDHEDGRLDVEIVEHGTAVNARVYGVLSVHGLLLLTVHGGGNSFCGVVVVVRVLSLLLLLLLLVTSRVSFVLAPTVDERIFLVRQVLH